ncbi:MAG: hypothetical protein ACXWRU_13235 [Pseudobdellovibrionaceae bacterium]
MTFSNLMKTLKDNDTKSIEEALLVVSRQYPEYLEFHTLMYDSFSLQKSSFLEPRVIVYGPKADFILTFNGGTHMRGGNALEVMQYDPSNGKFQFREITFKTPLKNETASLMTEEDIEFENSNMKYTKANPNKCTSCHGQTPKPIWETYFLWPGAYGGNDDTLTSLFNKKEVQYNGNYGSMLREGVRPGDSQGRLIKLKAGVTDNESLGFRKYIAGKFQHPRYKYLPNRAVDDAFVRLNSGENIDGIDTGDIVEKKFKDLITSGSNGFYYSRPNFALNELLYDLTVKSFALQAFSNPNTRSLPFKIAWIQNCMNFLEQTKASRSKDKDNLKNEGRDPFIELKDIITAAEEDQIRKVSGPWKEFYRKFVSNELDMQAEKIQRLERTFGENSLQVTKSYLPSRNEGRSQDYYKALKGRNLNRWEQIASCDENDDFYIEAASAYVAKGFGIELERFSTNLRRVPTLREGGFRYLLEEFIRRKMISKTSSPYSSRPDLKIVCPEILARANGN